MAYQTFTDALMEAKRRARLQGREVSQQEAAGITEGTAKAAQDRTLQEYAIKNQEKQFEKTLGQKERELSAQQSNFAAQLGQQKYQFSSEMGLKTKAFEEQVTQNAAQLKQAQDTLALQKQQFETASAAQKEQFGEQMQYQIAESENRVKQFETQLGVQQSQFAETQKLLQAQFEAQLAAANQANSGGGGGGCCIIVTIATNPTMKKQITEEEVDITRAYRDAFMPPWQLRGYYMVAEQLVPRMLKSERFMRWIKENIVDHLVPFCAWKTGQRKRPSLNTIIRVKAFLGLCSCVGMTRTSFTRCNGEVF
jgi:hypothetical protein